MKNIYEILESCGITMAEDAKQDFEKQLFASYKSAAEVEKKDTKITLLQQELDTARSTLQQLEQTDPEELKSRIAELEEQLSQKEQSYAQALAERDFTACLDAAIKDAKGRNPKAILALLDREALRESENRQQDILAAVEALKKSDGYLFEDQDTPPLYARGTGSFAGAQKKMPATLAGALKERFEKERK